jgi:hypothetical protein
MDARLREAAIRYAKDVVDDVRLHGRRLDEYAQNPLASPATLNAEQVRCIINTLGRGDIAGRDYVQRGEKGSLRITPSGDVHGLSKELLEEIHQIGFDAATSTVTDPKTCKVEIVPNSFKEGEATDKTMANRLADLNNKERNSGSLCRFNLPEAINGLKSETGPKKVQIAFFSPENQKGREDLKKRLLGYFPEGTVSDVTIDGESIFAEAQ